MLDSIIKTYNTQCVSSSSCFLRSKIHVHCNLVKMSCLLNCHLIQSCLDCLSRNSILFSLTHISRMDSPIIINWESPLSFLGVLGVVFIFISFFVEISLSKQNSPRWDAEFCGYTVCLCPTKGTPGLYELISLLY